MISGIVTSSLSVPNGTVVPSIGLPLCEIRANKQSNIAILEVIVSNAAAQIITYSFGRPKSPGLNPVAERRLLSFDPRDPESGVTICSAWGTPPEMPSIWSRQTNMSASSSTPQGVVWTFPRGFIVNPEKSAIVGIPSLTLPMTNAMVQVTVEE